MPAAMRISKRRPTVFKLPDLNLAPGTAGEDDEPPLLSDPPDLASQRIHAQNAPSRVHVDVSRASSPKVAPFQHSNTYTAARVSETATVLPVILGKEEMGQTLTSSQMQLQENPFPRLLPGDRIVNILDNTHKPAARIQKLGLSTADDNQGHHRIHSKIDYRWTTIPEEELRSANLHHSSASVGKSVSHEVAIIFTFLLAFRVKVRLKQ